MKSYIVSAKRTALGTFLGTLKNSSALELQSACIQAAISSIGLSTDAVEEVIIGNVLQAGNGQGLARQAAIKAGIREVTPAYAVNMICGSGLKSIMIASSEIACGRLHCVVAGGVEHMSGAPYLLPARSRTGSKFGHLTLVDSLIHDGLTDAFNNYHMGITAENVATKYTVSQEDQDIFAYGSQQKAITAIDSGVFTEEIIPIHIRVKKDTLVFDTDEHPNRTSTLEKLKRLSPAFSDAGSVTAGNSSGINDGASATLILSEQALEDMGINPIAEIVACTTVGIDPAYMGMGPLYACQDLLEKSGLSINDIDLIELNEAFAAQALAVIRELAKHCNTSVEHILEKTNVNGGAIALGHPIGCSGNRIVVTLLHEMKRRSARYGIATLCIGGGMGIAMLFKLVK